MAHDFDKWPELTNNQLQLYYFQSPHKQITENFTCRVAKVHDGDTITVEWRERDFAFPIRLAQIAAPELNEEGGKEAQEWLKERLLGKTVDVIIDPNNRVEKWGRILGTIYETGLNVAEEEIQRGLALDFEEAQHAS